MLLPTLSRLARALAHWWTATTEPASSRFALALTVVLHIAAGAFGLYHVARQLRPLVRAPAMPVLLSHGPHGTRFGIDEATRRAIFTTAAREEPASRRHAASDFPTHAWSQEDTRGALERNTMDGIIVARHLTRSQVYMVLDEGIRAHWLGPDGQPMRATVTPLNLRRR